LKYFVHSLPAIGTRAEGGFGELTRVFVNQMGLTTRNAVVILGAHSLGRAETANSGYRFVDIFLFYLVLWLLAAVSKFS
jgi:hypothetical protein